MIRLIALSAEGVNRQISTWCPGWNGAQKRAEKGTDPAEWIRRGGEGRHLGGEKGRQGKEKLGTQEWN